MPLKKYHFRMRAFEIIQGWLTVHPAKPFSGHHLEVNTLVTIFGIDKVGQFDSVELWKTISQEMLKSNSIQ